MLILNRRDFLRNATAFGALSAVGIAQGNSAEVGRPYPGWRPGEMDLHFVYTGCGENMFYRLPDGTAILNDTGEFYRPRDLDQVPLLPSPDRLGGEWMTRYLHRVYSEKTIDYAIFSHWHSDHIGHATYDRPASPDADFRHRTTADGRKINGFLCVAEDFKFKRYFDHQYPARGTYQTQDSSMQLLAPWVEEQKNKGLIVEPFKVGALNQIALQRDPVRYKDMFSIRNICANGVLWDGECGAHDYAAEHVEATKKKSIAQNQLSMAFVIQYGKFRYYTGGDVGRRFKVKGGGEVNYEGLVGKRVGPVTVCKMNHHGCGDSMDEEFVKAVCAQAYVACMWCPRQAAPKTLKTIMAHGDPAILPNLMPARRRTDEAGEAYMKNILVPHVAHVVVKVLPGGGAYRIYLLEAHDESMNVLSVVEKSV